MLYFLIFPKAQKTTKIGQELLNTGSKLTAIKVIFHLNKTGVGRMRVVELRVASCELQLQLRVASCELQLRVASCELRVAVASCSCELRVASSELPVAMENSVDSSSVFSKL